jgi:hypothetical protein
VKLLRRIGAFWSAPHSVYRWVALSFLAVCIVIPKAYAQDGANIPVIRVDARQVLIPTRVVTRFEYSYYDAVNLATRDFRLFEDNKEQTIKDAIKVHPFGTRLIADNQGHIFRRALTPKGEWTFPGNALLDHIPDTIYLLAYRPPESPDGSCHNIEIKVNPKSESGDRKTKVETGPYLWENKFRNETKAVNRRNLLLHYRTQYCNVPHPATDPLYGTPASERLEGAANSDQAEVNGFFLNAVDFYDESNTSRVRVALDFPDLSAQTGFPEFQIALLGEFNRTNGDLEARFTDSEINGCPIEAESVVASSISVFKKICGRDYFYNHYETEADLPPGDYNLRVAIDFGGALRRAEVPVHVRAPEKSLAVSGIALCRRYFAHDQPLQGPQPPPDGIPTLPFELTPLVSKGIEFTPTGNTHFQKKDPLVAYFEVYEPLLAAGGNVHAQFEIRIVDAKTGEIKSDSGFRPADGYVNPGKMIVPISQKVVIEELAPGEYQVQVRAKDSEGNSTDWRTTSFTRE